MSGIFNSIFGGAPRAPDYTPIAQANEAAARISAEVAREQLAEGRRQFEANQAIARPVVDAQLDIMRQTAEQGRELADYGRQFRPLEALLRDEAATGDEAAHAALRDEIMRRGVGDAAELRQRAQDFERAQTADAALLAGADADIEQRFGADIDARVGRAVADARAGQTQALSTAARQAARFGIMMPSDVTALTNQHAAQLAAAANEARLAATEQARQRLGVGMDARRQTFGITQDATADSMQRHTQALSGARNMRIQDRSLDFARRLDVAGLGRGLPGAAQGAYSVAVGAGSQAVQNQMAPGRQMQAALGDWGQTQLTGAQMAQRGAADLIGLQLRQHDIRRQSNRDRLEGIGEMVGAVSSIFAASDRRLKRNIRRVGRDERTGLDLYEFGYRHERKRRRYIGVMADEVRQRYPHAVVEREDGYAMVDYGALGITFREV